MEEKSIRTFLLSVSFGKTPGLATEQRPGSCTVWVNLLFYSLDVFSTLFFFPFYFLFSFFVCLFLIFTIPHC